MGFLGGIFNERKHILKLRSITNPKFQLQHNFEAKGNVSEMVDAATAPLAPLTSWLLAIDFLDFFTEGRHLVSC